MAHSSSSHSTISYQSPELLDSPQDGGNFPSITGSLIIPLTEREAYLLRNFVENMALWADVADLERHFEIEMPRRALHQPLLRYAIFAFSARHVNRFSDNETEALQYHSMCLQLLIPVLSGPTERITDDVLAAIAILRQYEEMDVHDNRYHLLGTTKILNLTSIFGSSGGLGEAAAWLCLREDIYVSLVSQQPLKTQLDGYCKSQTFQRDDDVSWANRMVFLLAKVLSYAFQHNIIVDAMSWEKMDEEVEKWQLEKPATFSPILFKPRSREDRRALPEVWMLSSFHVVGLQYYHIARIVLAMSTHLTPTSAYDNLRRGRRVEKIVHQHLVIVLGLAVSNRKTENTFFTARHALSVWGWVLREKLDQEAAISFLSDMEATTGWKTAELARSLRAQWEDDDDGN
ncbi:hypothetical protein AOQ84DRAFT_283017 [Glonium stellatum]|uniref:Uncharacterized protein n=1 Tax=Glonium stellatum TaxID=574774 RepID=A0A8E2FA94_9PEZI|nr:hypothetical protein AOQ84DRAFT_283017 [Glonium stellatum]